MLEIGVLCLWHRVVVLVNDFVQVLGDPLCHCMKLLIVELASLSIHEPSQANGGEIANGDLIWTGVLHYFSAEIRALDRAKVLLVRLAVTSVLVKHVRGSSFDLRFDDLSPKPLSLHSLPASAILFILSVELFELFTPCLCKPRALIRAHESPILVLLDSLHEEIWYPESIEKITSSVFFLSVVLAELKIFIDIGMPGLKVDSESTSSLSTSLVNIASSVIEDLKHGDKAI
jgi:hypothetical protein